MSNERFPLHIVGLALVVLGLLVAMLGLAAARPAVRVQGQTTSYDFTKTITYPSPSEGGAFVGESLTVTLTFKNPYADAHHLKVQDNNPAPTYLRILTETISAGAVYSPTVDAVIWEHSLDGNTSATVTFQMLVIGGSGQRVTNEAWLHDREEPSTLPYYVDTAEIHILARIYLPLVIRNYTPPAPDLSISTKTADKAAVNAGEVLAYTVVLTNSGDMPASVVFADPIPGQSSFVSGSAQNCTYSAGENQVKWSGPLPVGDTHTCQFSVQTAATATGNIVNDATVRDGYRPMPLSLIRSTPVMVVNGGFETGSTAGWSVTGDSVLPAPQVLAAAPHGGSYDLLLGGANYCLAPNPGQGGDHSSMATQTIYVPNVAGTPTLHFWYRILTYDHLTWTDGRLGDSLDVYVAGERALRDNYENAPAAAPGCSSRQDSGWREPANPWGGQVATQVLDLGEWKGQSVEVRFELWTRWDGSYNTWAYLDDVRVEIQP
jgi:uncharacterized repeat protein (TIGR01451 family)